MKDKEEEPENPVIGFVVAADLWLWGAILLYIPIYLGIAGIGRTLFNILGFALIAFSFTGVLLELNKLWESKGLTYWISLIFLISAIVLHIARWKTIVKVAILILVVIGIPLSFLIYFLWKRVEKPTGELSSEETTKRGKRKGLGNWIGSLFFLLPAFILYTTSSASTSQLGTIAKVVTLILVAIGGPFFLYGTSYFLWKPAQKPTEEPSSEETTE